LKCLDITLTGAPSWRSASNRATVHIWTYCLTPGPSYSEHP
jgi:hypothetical protein